MSRETYAERKRREAVRDRIRRAGIESAEHTAGACMVPIERTGEEWPVVRFLRPLPPHRCECGGERTPLPVPHKRFGWLQTWFCPYCGLDDLVATCVRISEAAVSQAKPQP